MNRRGIYKDVVDPEIPWTAYQLRPNVCVAMVFAPKLFSVERAMTCLEIIKSTLLGPLGTIHLVY